jgi:hypothetical protein
MLQPDEPQLAGLAGDDERPLDIVEQTHALRIERSCTLVASAFSEGRRVGVRLVSGERRSFGMDATRTIVNVPYPALAPSWTLRSLTCGVALQCAPSKDRIARYPLHELSPRELGALSIVEGAVALGWVGSRWPGLLPELRRLLPDLEMQDGELDARAMLGRATALARSGQPLRGHPLLGQLPLAVPVQRGLLASARRMMGRMRWSSRRTFSRGRHTIPVGGEGGIQNPNLPPPSRPEDEEIEIRSDRRVGIPYPEWNAWTQRFLPDHVAVLERKHPSRSARARPISADLRRWFEEHTHRATKNRLEDGSDLDIDQYIDHYVATVSGEAFYYISQRAERPVGFMPQQLTDQRVIAVYFDRKRRVERLADYGLKDGRIFDFVTRTTPTGGKDTGLITGMFKLF